MKMRSPTQTTPQQRVNVRVGARLPGVAGESLQFRELILSQNLAKEPFKDDPSRMEEGALDSSMDTLESSQQTKIVPEPTREPSTAPAPKLGISRSQDDASNNEDLWERKFVNVSPVFSNSTSRMGSARISRLRSAFRRSHTCGSLFANCSCNGGSNHSNVSSRATATVATHASGSGLRSSIESNTFAAANAANAANAAKRTPDAQRHRTSPNSECSPAASPASPSTPPPLSTSSSTKLSSGYYSLSAQTSAATSAQLSRDESLSTSFDYGATSSANTRTLSHSHGIGGDDFAGESLSWGPSSVDSSLLAKPPVNTESEPRAGARKHPPHTSRLGSPRAAACSPDRTVRGTEPRQQQPKRLFQSYSHPDTDFVFTDENKHPSRECLVQVHALSQDTVIKTRGGKVEIKQSKRSSSPNIGQYRVLDVAVHPDILVKVSPKHSPTIESRRPHAAPPSRSAAQRRRLLRRSREIDSAGSTSGSEHSLELSSPKEAFHPTTASPLNSSGPSAVAPPPGPSADTSFDAAHRYFAESGVLGPIGGSCGLIRKTSKILQDSNIIEQIRKTSIILRSGAVSSGNSSGGPIRATPTATTTVAVAAAAVAPVPAAHRGHTPLTLKFQNNANMEMTSSSLVFKTSSPKSQQTVTGTCAFSPNLTAQRCSVADDKDVHIKNLLGEIVSLKDVIKSRDAEIVKLRREIHKLKSVLQQTTDHLPIVNDELLKSPTSPTTLASPPKASLCLMSSQCTQLSNSREDLCENCKRLLKKEEVALSSGREGGNGSSVDSTLREVCEVCNSSAASTGTASDTCAPIALEAINEEAASTAARNDTSCASVGLEKSSSGGASASMKALRMTPAPVLKKQGVSGESCETSMHQSFSVPIPKYDKDFSAKQLIKDAIMDNDFLKNIDASQVRELVESMYPLSVPQGKFVIREGEAGAHLYVSAEGEFEVRKNGKVLGVMGPGKAFGELAILYNCTRTASIRVLSDARVWVLDRRIFQQIMMRTGMQRIENSVNFLRSVPLLKNLSEEVLAKIADVLEVEFYPAGTYIIRQGASGDTFFLISQGSVKVTQKLQPLSEEKEIRTLERGDYFGEQALINEDKRTANIIAMPPGVECLTLDRESFTHLIGDLSELKEKSYGDETRASAITFAEQSKEVFGANVQQEFPNMKLTDLEVVATLGIGGFGRVELVKAYQDNRVDTFALKCMRKRHIVDTKQEEHVFSERTIMLTCNSPFICRLYRTFRDEKYIYMLLEACMGGEIWTMLRDRGSFNENATQFIIGCVLEAFEYLHARGIIYRDLKPENLMLDERGYVKLVDFGFAKHIGHSSKTWTFCGTPEYVAPEIILNKGHDRAVDYWALGVLIHELLNGTPPFTANDPMKTYNIILKGIDMIDFPKHMSRSAVQLIKKLCRDVPAERLGYQKAGIQDIKKHKWFLGFDWDGLHSQLLIPPFIRPIAHPTDTCYFDTFPCDPNEPPDETSGWDADF